MQSLLARESAQKHIINDTILQLLSDKYCRSIIETTRWQYKSADQIFKDTNIPTSTLYRRLRSLVSNKVLRIKETISEDGKKTFLYKSRISSVFALFDGEQLKMEITPNETEEGIVTEFNNQNSPFIANTQNKYPDFNQNPKTCQSFWRTANG